MDKKNHVMVSICCAAYNHEQYIANTIESFLMQITNFQYEVLIHDDASTDKTTEIIKSYEQKYPEIIKPIYQTVNQYSKGIKIDSAFNFPRAKGKYIAFCEGDDYWTDPKKLQLQFECLEKAPDIVCCYHEALVKNERGLIKGSALLSEFKKPYTCREMMTCQTHIFPSTAFFRNVDALQNYPPEAKFVKNGDTFLFSILGQYGSGMYLAGIDPTIYIFHEEGIWSMKSEVEKKAMRMNTLYWLSEYYSRLEDYDIEEEFKFMYLRTAMSGLFQSKLLPFFLQKIPRRFLKILK